jgi:hypothetical protein
MEWNIASWARLVGKGEYQARRRVYGTTGMVYDVITEALASAADDTGLLPAFELPTFYRVHIGKLLCTDDADAHPGFRELTYDAFSAVVLMEHLNRLLAAGLLAQAAEGHDYHLALPGASAEQTAAAFPRQEAGDEREAGR